MISRKFILGVAVALFALAALPSLASALTITVDDDRAQCPLADETSLTAAVAAAANGDTVKICAGTYNVPGGPAPSSGLKIEKNISLAGAGSDKVFVQPTQGTGSMAQAAPNPRDEYGNVITVRRRLIELYDVSISGLTVRAGNVPVEAGIAMIDVVTGSISSVKVEGIVPLSGSTPLPGTGAFAPEIESLPNPLSEHGQAVVVANTIEQTQNTTTISGSQFSQFNSTGVLVDARRLSGASSVGNKSTVTAKIVNTRITGAGGTPPVAQTGIEAWGSGAAVQLTKSKIAGVGKADGSAAAFEAHGIDLANTLLGGTEADRNDLTANAYGATNVAFDGSPAGVALKAGGNFWGTTVGGEPPLPLVGADVETAPTMPTAPAATTLAAIVDDLPTAQWDTRPAEGAVLTPGTPVPLAVMASDDFGVKSVEFRLNGLGIGTSPTPALLGERIYTGSWTPSAAYAGENTLSAVVSDSASQTREIKVTVQVEGKPRFTAVPTISGQLGGYAAVGKPLTCSPGTAAAYPAPTYSYAWTVAGVAVGTDSPTYTPVAADQGKKVLCTVKASNGLGSATQASGQVPVADEPEFASAALISGGNTSAYAQQGKLLTCSAGAASGEPAPTTAVAWTRGATTVATTPTYAVAAADVGSTLTCTFTATSATGEATTAASIKAGAPPSFAGSAGVIGGTASGYAVVGKTLTCASGSPAGAPAPSVSFAWSAGGSPVGTNASTYTPTLADQGKQIGCEVTIANFIGSVSDGAATVTVGTVPVFGSPAAIAGGSGPIGSVGDTLTCSADAGGDPAPGVSYAWLREGTPVGSGPSYAVGAADAGHVITCTATATSLAGSSTSSSTLGIGSPPKDGAPLLGGTAKAGSTLTCEPGTWTAIPQASFAYAWLRDGAPIAGATGPSYTATVADVGALLACEVTASNELGAGKATSSAVTVAATPPALAKKAGGGAVSGRVASLGSISCSVGPCTVGGPKEVKVKIGGVAYKAKLVYPGKIASGGRGAVKLKLTKAGKKALAKAGKSAKLTFKLTIDGGGGKVTGTFSLRLEAPKK